MFRKMFAYNILPLLLIIASFSFILQYQPRFSWNISVKSIEGDSKRYKVLPTAMSGLNEKPDIRVWDNSQKFYCATSQTVTYVDNDLLKGKTSIEHKLGSANGLLSLTLLFVILDLAILVISLLIINRVSLITTLIFGCSLGIIAIAILMLLGPITSIQYICIVEISTQAELTNISEIGLQYFHLSIILALSSLILIPFRHIFFHNMFFKPHSQTPTPQ